MRLRRSMTGLAMLVALVILASGCTVPKHSNTLLFGTNTQIALNASYDTTTQQGGISLGYKRQELVWMPLMVNKAAVVQKDEPTGDVPSEVFLATQASGQASSSKASAAQPSGSGVSQAQGAGSGAAGNAGQSSVVSRDALSVIANLGASNNTSASPSGIQSGGTISQFIATGFAARILAEKGGDRLVSTSAATQTAAAAEMGKAQAYVKEVDKSVDAKLSSLTINGSDTLDKPTVDAFVKLNPTVGPLFVGVTTKSEVQKRLNDVIYMPYAVDLAKATLPPSGGGS